MTAARASSPGVPSPPKFNLDSPLSTRQSSSSPSPRSYSGYGKAASSRHAPPGPILIPTTPRYQRDPNKVPTPVSGRGDRRSNWFPSAYRDISPLRLSHSPPERGTDFQVHIKSIQKSPSRSPELSATSLLRAPSHSPRFQSLTVKMHTERGSYYTPTSPLSPTMNPSIHPVAAQPNTHTRHRSHHSPQSKNKSTTLKPSSLGSLPRYHPARFESAAPTMTTTPPPPSPTSTSVSATIVDSPKAMRRYQRELLAKADYSSRLAASPFGHKPSSPRLDPMGSPGPVTPLVLEQGSDEGDYFLVGARAGLPGSLAVSPKVGSGTGGDKAGEAPIQVRAGSPNIGGRDLIDRR